MASTSSSPGSSPTSQLPSSSSSFPLSTVSLSGVDGTTQHTVTLFPTSSVSPTFPRAEGATGVGAKVASFVQKGPSGGLLAMAGVGLSLVPVTAVALAGVALEKLPHEMTKYGSEDQLKARLEASYGKEETDIKWKVNQRLNAETKQQITTNLLSENGTEETRGVSLRDVAKAMDACDLSTDDGRDKFNQLAELMYQVNEELDPAVKLPNISSTNTDHTGRANAIKDFLRVRDESTGHLVKRGAWNLLKVLGCGLGGVAITGGAFVVGLALELLVIGIVAVAVVTAGIGSILYVLGSLLWRVIKTIGTEGKRELEDKGQTLAHLWAGRRQQDFNTEGPIASTLPIDTDEGQRNPMVPPPLTLNAETLHSSSSVPPASETFPSSSSSSSSSSNPANTEENGN